MTFGRCLAFYISSIVGVGVLGLPALAYTASGLWSLLAWLIAICLGAAVGYFFLQLALRHADEGGVSDYARAAFGPGSGAFCGYLFYFAVPFGAPATAHIAALMLAPEGSWPYWAVLGGIVVTAVAANAVGASLASGIQLVGTGILCAVLATAIIGGALHVTPEHFAHGPTRGPVSTLSALLIVFFAFAGWEAVAGFAGDALRAGVNLRWITAITVTVVSALYVGFAFTAVGVAGPRLLTNPDALGIMLSAAFGPQAVWVARTVSVLLGFLAVNAFIGSASRLGADLSRRHLLPSTVSWSKATHHSVQIGVLGAGLTLVLTVSAIGMDTSVSIASGLFASVTIIGLLSAAVLLRLRVLARVLLTGTTLVLASAIVTSPPAVVTIAVLALLLLGTRAVSPRLYGWARKHPKSSQSSSTAKATTASYGPSR